MNRVAKLFAAGSLAIAAGAPGAQADILAFAARESAVGVADTLQPIPLREDGSTTLTFRTTKPNTFVVVTYTATCYVQYYSDAGGLGTVRIQIEIDSFEPRPQPWSSTNNLCTAENTRTGYAAHSRQVGMRVRRAGTHTLDVRPSATQASTTPPSIPPPS